MNHENILSKVQAAMNWSEPSPLHASMRAEIDKSLCGPLVFLIRSSLFNLVVGSILGLICALKLVVPSFCDGFSFLTYGRLSAVSTNLLLYGWAVPAGLAMILWLMARLSGTSLRNTTVLYSAAVLWTIGVFLGSLALMAGFGTAVPFLEYPSWASFVLFCAFILMGVWGIVLIRERQPRALYVSQWYFLAALCSFPWSYGTANMLLTWGKIQGSAQPPIQCWYLGSFIQFWLVPVALAIIYYIIPKVSGVKIYSYYLALIGFFSLFLFAGWSGLGSLIGGPIPAWMASAGVIANNLLFLPMIAVAINFYYMLQQGESKLLQQSPALRFITVGIIFYVIATVLSLLNSFPCMSGIFNFTDYPSGVFLALLFGFFGMSIFGGLYYIIPRLTGISWACHSLIRWHFWLAVVGVSLMVSSMILGGMIEGFALNDAGIVFVNVLSYAAPWRWLVMVSWMLLIASFLCFVRLLVIMRWQNIEKLF